MPRGRCSSKDLQGAAQAIALQILFLLSLASGNVSIHTEYPHEFLFQEGKWCFPVDGEYSLLNYFYVCSVKCSSPETPIRDSSRKVPVEPILR